MAEQPATTRTPVRHYISFHHDGAEWMFDLSFLTSSWKCIFGEGCQGVLTGPSPELGHGCCSYGAHFTDDGDLQRVAEAASRLTDEHWQFRQEALRRGGPFKRQGEASVSRLVDGACIFLNRTGSSQGHGCALHIGALAAGERPLDWKPEVCWQLPLRMTYHEDENERITHTLRSWDRPDWGDGGAEFHWWCTEDEGAFVGHQPVYIEMRDEIIAMVGPIRYQMLVDHIESQGIESHNTATPVPSPSLKKRPPAADVG